MKRIRVGLVLHRVQSRRLGGADRSMLAAVEVLRDRVSFTGIAPHECDTCIALNAIGVPTHIVPYANGFSYSRARGLWRRLGYIRSAWLNNVAARRIASLADTLRLNVIHSNSLVVDVGYRASKYSGLPHIWHVREVLGGGHIGESVVGDRSLRGQLSKSRAVIGVSRFALDSLGIEEGLFNGTVIYNGVIKMADVKRAGLGGGRTRTSSGSIGKLRRRVCFIGGVSRPKGQWLAVEAISQVVRNGCDVEMVIAGDGNDLPRVLELAKSLGIGDRVVPLGRVDSPWPVLADSDLSLVCSEAEAMGRVAAESMLAGVPLVAVEGGAMSELLGGGTRGLLVARESGALAEGIMSAFRRHDEAMARAIIAQRWARSQFVAEDCGRKVLDVYQEVVA